MHPTLRLLPKHDRRLRTGHPWAYSNELALRPEHRAWPPGAPINLEGDDGRPFGTFLFNPHSLIAARRLSPIPNLPIDSPFLATRLANAASLRARLSLGAHHRLIHAEADGLPGLVIDRYGDLAVLQANTAGMDRLLPEITAALLALHPWQGIVARNDSAARTQEGLPQTIRLLHGTAENAHTSEGGIRFALDPLSGQKTGFFHDQRPNRDLIARLAPGARILDLFCHLGAFGLRALAAGAASALLIDASAPALDAARHAAETNDLLPRAILRRGDAFETMQSLAAEAAQFDIVICDPPAFAKSRKDQEAGLRAYQRMARLAAPLVAPAGFLFCASCSHHAPLPLFAEALATGLHRAHREPRLLHTGHAGPDHPVHPHLPESAYLKSQLFQLA